MFNIKRPSGHERKLAFHGEAAFAKHDYRYRQRGDIRMAGQVWAEGENEKQRRLERGRYFASMRQTPVGLGFGNKDSFGPDENYDTKDLIRQTPDQGHYRYR